MEKEKVISKAVVFIENNLYEPFTAQDVANAVSYSYYHFHRYFQAVMGETIGNYIRGRRLTQASWDLLHTDKKVLDIGCSLYFETAESFCRAFKERYSMTPTEYRKNGVNIVIGKRMCAQKDDGTLIAKGYLFSQIITLPSTCIMGIRFPTDAIGSNCSTMWGLFDKQFIAICKQLPASHNRYTIFETGQTCSKKTFNICSEAQVFIGIEVPQNYPFFNGMQKKKLVGGKYAKFIHKGKIDSLIQTYHYIWGVWLPKNKYELDNRDDFECYTDRFVGEDNELSEVDIYLPIK